MNTKLSKTIFFILISALAFASADPPRKISYTPSKTDTLHFMLSEKNVFYYYENELMEDASNFSSTNARGVKHVITLYSNESKERGNEFFIVLKILNETLINENSKAAIDLIKQQKYKRAGLTEVEKELIAITERQ